MFLSRQNLKGGPKLKSCPIDIDIKTNRVGYRLGYCSGCNESIMVGTGELQEILEYFGMTDHHKKESFREKLIHVLGGQIKEV